MKSLFRICTAAGIILTGSLAAFEADHYIFPAGVEATIRFKAKSDFAKKWLENTIRLRKEGKDKIKNPLTDMPIFGYIREDRRHSTSEKFQDYGYPEELDFKIEGDEVVTTVKLNGLENHNFRFTIPMPRRKRLPNGKRPPRVKSFTVAKVLTVDAETFKLRPFKGNVHQHCSLSDHAVIDPEEHIGYGRIAGFDYIGISEHNEFRQNARAIKEAAESGSGLTVYPAEEVHSPAAVLHALAIGGKESYSHRKSRTPEWNKIVQPVLDELKKKYPAGTDEFDLRLIAESLILLRRAKADGALTVFCHPGYTPSDLYRNNNFIMSNHLITCNEVDVVELINGSNSYNMETLAQYFELARKTGINKPVMSSSDCHNVSRATYRNLYNVIFAPDCTFPSFKAAFLEGRAVASINILVNPKRYSPRHVGALKYVRYANFLDRIGYWKKHDRLAKKQGELLLKYTRGDKSVKPQIIKLAGQIDALRESLYYKPAK